LGIFWPVFLRKNQLWAYSHSALVQAQLL
jgi:hypothetical protein